MYEWIKGGIRSEFMPLWTGSHLPVATNEHQENSEPLTIALYKSSPFIPSHLMTHTFVCYNRICLILKKLNRHIQYGHHFKALGMYLKTTMTFMAKCNSIWRFLSEVSPATRNDLQPADSAAICISRRLLLVRASAGSWMRSGALLATENRLLIGHLCATPLFATAQVVHFPI